MPRTAPLLFIALALATATTLSALALTFRDPGVTPPVESEGDIALVHRFFAGVNAVMETGDASSLRGLLAPNFVRHAAADSEPTVGEAGLVVAIQSHRAIYPHSRIAIDDIQSSSLGELIVRLHADPVSAAQFLGLNISGDVETWTGLSLLRIESDRIAEWRSLSADSVRFDQLVFAPLPASSSPDPETISSLRLTFPPGSVLRWPSERSIRVFAVSQGTLHFSGIDAENDAHIEGKTVGPGASTVFQPGDTVVISNSGDTEASALLTVVSSAWSVRTARNANATAESQPLAIRVKPSAGGSAELLGVSPGVAVGAGTPLGIGTIYLEPGETIGIASAADRAMFSVLTGEIALKVSGSVLATLPNAALGSEIRDREVSLPVGTHIVAGANAAIHIDATGLDPVELLVTTVGNSTGVSDASV